MFTRVPPGARSHLHLHLQSDSSALGTISTSGVASASAFSAPAATTATSSYFRVSSRVSSTAPSFTSALAANNITTAPSNPDYATGRHLHPAVSPRATAAATAASATASGHPPPAAQSALSPLVSAAATPSLIPPSEADLSLLVGRQPRMYVVLISLHGLIRGNRMELGRDPDTGGQVGTDRKEGQEGSC